MNAIFSTPILASTSLEERAQKVKFPLPRGAKPPIGCDCSRVEDVISRAVQEFEQTGRLAPPRTRIRISEDWN